MKENLFSDKIFCKKLLQLTAPIALQSLMLASVAAADAVMLGSVAQNSMAAVSLATQIQFIQNMILMAFVAAAGICHLRRHSKISFPKAKGGFVYGMETGPQRPQLPVRAAAGCDGTRGR